MSAKVRKPQKALQWQLTSYASWKYLLTLKGPLGRYGYKVTIQQGLRGWSSIVKSVLGGEIPLCQISKGHASAPVTAAPSRTAIELKINGRGAYRCPSPAYG